MRLNTIDVCCAGNILYGDVFGKQLAHRCMDSGYYQDRSSSASTSSKSCNISTHIVSVILWRHVLHGPLLQVIIQRFIWSREIFLTTTITDFMLIYRFFHVRRLRYEAGGRMTASNLTALSNQVFIPKGKPKKNNLKTYIISKDKSCKIFS